MADAKIERYVEKQKARRGMLEERDAYLPPLIIGERKLPGVDANWEGAA